MASTTTSVANIPTTTVVGPPIDLKIVAINAVCTMSDDEGPYNAADISRFLITFYAYDGKADGTNVVIVKDRDLWSWEGSDPLTVPKDYDWKIAQSKHVQFTHGGLNDFNYAKLVIKVWARESDLLGHEEGNAELTLTGKSIYGDHTIKVSSSDFAFDVNFRISDADPVWFLRNNHSSLYYDFLVKGDWTVSGGKDSELLQDVIKYGGAVHCVDGRPYTDITQPYIMRGPKIQGGVLGIVALNPEIKPNEEGIKKAIGLITAAGYIASVHGDSHHVLDKHPAEGCGFATKWHDGELTTLNNKTLTTLGKKTWNITKMTDGKSEILSPDDVSGIVTTNNLGQIIILPGEHTEERVRLNFVENKTFEPDGKAFNLDVWFAAKVGIDADSLIRNALDTVKTLVGLKPIEVFI